MSREIKFRAWDKEYSKWLPSNLVDLVFNKDGSLTGVVGISIVELVQYTGLTDKNGKEIYEGDIVSDGAVVKWYDSLTWDGGGSAHPGFYCEEWCEYKDDGELSYQDGFDQEIEVIGNIYENPELLK